MIKDILIVEDETSFALTLGSLLKEQGHTVRIASNGKEGLEQIRGRVPDLLVTDLRMPVMGGAELIKRARQETGDGLAVLVITTSPRILSEEKIQVARVIQKPLMFEEALEAIEEIFARS